MVRVDANTTPVLHHRSTPLRLPDKPSIAVLPFNNMSSDPEQDYFADGMVEEIITALARITHRSVTKTTFQLYKTVVSAIAGV